MEKAEKQKAPDLNRLQKLVLRLRGNVYVGRRTRPGWKGSLPFYAFRCPEHGIVENYPQGYGKILRCPICHEEALENGGRQHSPPLEGLLDGDERSKVSR